MASVVGFDVGSKTSFVAVAKAGGVETVANEYSQRATPSYVSFGENIRDLGTSAQQKLVTNLKNTVWLFKHLVGRPFDDEIVKRYQPLLPYEICQMEETGRVGIKVVHGAKDYVFGVEQILGMLLGKLRDIASTGLENRPVSDCVIACPFYLTNSERWAWLEAAKIAGLNPLKLMNETTAIALAYGLFKTDLPEPGQKSRTVAFVDIGYTQTQVCIASFNKGSLKIISTSGDRNLGGLDFDLVLANHFTEEFKGKYKIDVKTKKRAELRLYNECEKLKKLMSANATEMSMNVECIMNDMDVSGKMKREQFEKICEDAGYMDKFRVVLNECISQFKKETEKDKDISIDAVEMVGGSCRVPWVKELITETFGIAPGTSLNSDEAVSRGACLQCAILSPAYRVRDFSINDCQPHNIRIDWLGSDNKNGNALLFKQNESIPISKVLTFTRKDLNPFTIKASYVEEGFTAHPNRHIGDYIVADLKEPETPAENGAMKVKVKLRIDGNGLLVIPQAVQIDKKEVEEEIKEPMADPAADDKNKKAEDKKPEQNGDAQPEAENKEAEKPADAAAEAPAQEEMADEPAKPKTKTVLKPIKIELAVSDDIQGKLLDKIVNSYVEAENELCVLDKKEKDRQDAKNELESYIYDSRDKLSGVYSEFSTEQEKENLSSTLTKSEDWLYEEGYDEKKSVYISKHSDLVALLKPIVLRYNEFNTRKPAIDNLLNYIQTVEKFVAKYNNNDVDLVHIDAEKVKLVDNKLRDIKNWANNATVKISQTAKTADPSILTSELVDKLHDLKINSKATMETPKPKPKEEKKEEKKEDEEGEKKAEDGADNADNKNSEKQPENAEKTQEDKNSPRVAEDMDLD